MDFYRGDNRGPTDKKLRTIGFDPKPPAKAMNGVEARQFLAAQYQKTTYSIVLKKNIPVGTHGFANDWVVHTPGNLMSTAMTDGGTFAQMNYRYKITIPDSELTLQLIDDSGNLSSLTGVGNKTLSQQALELKKYFLLFNNGSYQLADLIALCHGTIGTKEATFLNIIPAKYAVGYKTKQDNQKVPYKPLPPYP